MTIYFFYGVYLMLGIFGLFLLDEEDYKDMPLSVFIMLFLGAPYIMICSALLDLFGKENQIW